MTGPEPRRSTARRSKTFRALRILFPAALVAVAFATIIEPGELARTLTTASVAVVLAVVAVACLDLGVMAAKWLLLVRAYGVPVTLGESISAYFRSEVFALFLPSILGTDGYRAWFFRQRGYRVGPVVASIIVERAVGLLSSIAVVCLLGPFGLRAIAGSAPWWLTPAGLAAYLLLWAALLFVVGRARAAARWRIWRRLPRRGAVQVIRALRSLGRISSHRGVVGLYYAASQGEKLAYGVVIWLAAVSLHIPGVPFVAIVAATPVVAMLERLPISIRAIGVREGLYVALLAPFGVAPTEAFSVALVVRAAELVRSGAGLALWGVEPRASAGTRPVTTES